MQKFICLDIEATGLNNLTEDIIEVAAVKFNLLDQEIETFHTLIHTDIEISNLIHNLTGINNQMLVNSPSLDSIKNDLINFCQDLPIVGHNISFDTNFLSAKDIHLPNLLIDTLPLSQAVLDNEDSFSLEILCQKYNQIYQPSHRALDDVLANIELFKILINKFKNFDHHQHTLFHNIFKPLNTEHNNYTLYKLLDEKTNHQIIFESTNKIRNEKFQKLIVCNTDIVSNISTPVLPEPKTIINQDKVLQNITNLSSEELNSHFFLILSIICKIKETSPLLNSSLNIKVSTPEFIKNAISDEYIFFEQSDTVTCNYKTFFYFQKNNLLTNFEQIEILHDPYLVEGYLKSQEIYINIHKINSKDETEISLIKLFSQLEDFLNSKITDKESLYKFHILDMFEKNDTFFQNLLSNIKDINQSNELDISIQKLLSNANQYYIWLEQYNNNPVQIIAIPKNTLIDDKQILSNIDHPNINIPNFPTTSINILNNIAHSADLKSQDFTNFVIAYINKNLLNTTHTSIVISPTKHIIKQIHETLSIDLKKQGISLLSQDISGSKGKILQLIQSNESPTILLCTHHFLLKFQPEISHLEQAVLAKLPIGLPSHKIYKILEKENENAFYELTLPQTATAIRNLLILLNQKYKINKVDNLDTRLTDTKWGKKIFDQI